MADLFDEIERDIAARWVFLGRQVANTARYLVSVDVEYGAGGQVVVRSKPGESPRRETHRLQDSIDHEVTDEAEGPSLTVSSDCPYAPMLEFGTANMEPRPFFVPTFEEWAEEMIDQTIKTVQNP